MHEPENDPRIVEVSQKLGDQLDAAYHVANGAIGIMVGDARGRNKKTGKRIVRRVIQLHQDNDIIVFPTKAVARAIAERLLQLADQEDNLQ